MVSAWHAAGNNGRVSTEDLLLELQRTQPLSVVMAEPMQALREWAASRAVAAD